jgi:XTP/dITP diphosphohydrolase
MQRVVLATRNRHKTREFAALLGEVFQIEGLSSWSNLPVIEETGATFAENAIVKAIAVARCVSGWIVADDSGLQVEALNGAPGIYSARYSSLHASDSENVAKLLDELRGKSQREARFRCVLALARAGELIATFEGVIEGRISDEPRGHRGFGYDPVFVPHGFDKTFAESGAELKNKISHRARAARALRDFLQRQPD